MGILTPVTNFDLLNGRRQGVIFLRMTEQCIGLVLKLNPFFSNNEETTVVCNNYGIYITSVENEDTSNNYGIYITRVENDDTRNYFPDVFLRDTSTFDIYVNRSKDTPVERFYMFANEQKLSKGKPLQIYDGDFISLGGVPMDVKDNDVSIQSYS
ncbi:uncharacterized protein LOC120008685 [Tripterygium wilfordii]|uniref:uncharacterized protein LOC120008685 n=1 Tax=Tripterygium wilfordii TaxID=458696 RepID=UPI0018F85650|nr:uncharacterized protein LOC120008685 [Tripterygium wilfordii]